jgi:uncharacterized protein YkuJ
MSGSGTNWTHSRQFESSGSKKIEVKTFDSNGTQVDYDYEYLSVSSIAGSDAYINRISFSDTTPEVGQSIRTTVTTIATAYRVEVRYDVQWFTMSGSGTNWTHDRIFESAGYKTIEVKTLDSNMNQVDYKVQILQLIMRIPIHGKVEHGVAVTAVAKKLCHITVNAVMALMSVKAIAQEQNQQTHSHVLAEIALHISGIKANGVFAIAIVSKHYHIIVNRIIVLP